MGDVRLPVVHGERRAGAERMGRRRAIALVAVHVIVALHIAHWKLAGSTLTPLEPSEAGHSIITGAINAGAVLLCVAILATLLLGRFFCGWACHVVAYQDACRWLLLKIGLRPQPFRSKLLLFVPLFAAYWLYGKPLVDRWIAQQEAPALSWHFTTDDFWVTFPGPLVTALTVLVCGFLIVYLLGAKGFCTYGCPYGGLFAIADRFSRGRIRVTDDCDGSGHCTANCSSNVDVAGEVARYGKVVDPGCMKCLDCVAGCPNEALYFGYGSRATAARRRRPSSMWKAGSTWLALLIGIGLAIAFHADWRTGLGLSAVILVVGAGMTMRRVHSRDTTLSTGEELLLVGAFATIMAVTFNLYRAIPLLLSIGLAACGAFALLRAAQVIGRSTVSIQQLDLKIDGHLRPHGVVMLAAGGLLVTAVIHAGLIQWNTREAVAAFGVAELARVHQDESKLQAASAETLRHLQRIDRWSPVHTRGHGRMLGELHRWAGRHDLALAAYERDLAGFKPNPILPLLQALSLHASGETEAAWRQIETNLDRGAPARDRYLQMAWEAVRLGDRDLQRLCLQRGHEAHPADPRIALELGQHLANPRNPRQDIDLAIDVVTSALELLERSDPDLLGLLSWLLRQSGRPVEALHAARDAAARALETGDRRLAEQMNAVAADIAAELKED